MGVVLWEIRDTNALALHVCLPLYLNFFLGVCSQNDPSFKNKY